MHLNCVNVTDVKLCVLLTAHLGIFLFNDKLDSQFLINQYDAAGQWPLLLHFLTTLHVSGASCTHHQEFNNCICSLWHKVHIGRPPSYVAEFKLHTQLLNSWWWVQEVPETCRVVKRCSNKGHCPAASCWFVWNWYVMHGTMNLKFTRFFFVYVYFNSLHVSSIQVLIIRRFSCINTIYGICHSM